MSTASGFVLGVLAAASLTVIYGDKLHSSLDAAAERYSLDLLPAMELEQAGPLPELSPQSPQPLSQQLPQQLPQQRSQKLSAEQLPRPAPASPPLIQPEAVVQAAAVEPAVTDDAGPSLEQRWAEFAALADTLQVAGEFPWRSCFARAAASYELPEPLLLAIASGESNFDPAARSHKDAVGLMQIRWPGTSRHLGVVREADLYDPCTNVDAGARYLLELADRFDNNLHLMVAAYNYGPGRIAPGQVPDGARWYSQYIYQHLQQVLGAEHVATSQLIRGSVNSATGRQVLMSFNVPHRARDFINFLKGEVPNLNLQQQSEALGQHDVVLLYQDESERQGALESISAAGVLPMVPRSTSKRYL